MSADPAIKLNPGTSVLGLDVGERIRLTEGDFALIANAFFTEIESRYASGP